MAELTSSPSLTSAQAQARAQRYSRGGSGGSIPYGSMSIDQSYSTQGYATSPPAGIAAAHRKSVSALMTRRPSVSNDAEYQYYPPQRRVILGRPARVFWDLENCAIGGRDYMAEIMRTIQLRVEADTGMEVFEIFASYHHASHIPSEVYQELIAYDVNFNKVEAVSGDSKSSVEDDIYKEVDKFIDTQSQRTHLFPYVLLIAGHVSLVDKIDPLEKRGKIVYAIRKDKDTNFGTTLGKHVVYEYSMTKGIQNRIN